MSKLFDMLSISLITSSKNILKRVGERRHPCLTPTSTLNHSVSFPSIVTAHLDFLKNFFKKRFCYFTRKRFKEHLIPKAYFFFIPYFCEKLIVIWNGSL